MASQMAANHDHAPPHSLRRLDVLRSIDLETRVIRFRRFPIPKTIASEEPGNVGLEFGKCLVVIPDTPKCQPRAVEGLAEFSPTFRRYRCDQPAEHSEERVRAFWSQDPQRGENRFVINGFPTE